MRLMGSWTGQSMADERIGFWAVEGLWNKKADVKSWNTVRLSSVVFTWHLHFLLLSSLRSFVTRVMLQQLFPISSYLHGGEIIRETPSGCHSSVVNVLYILYCSVLSRQLGDILYLAVNKFNEETQSNNELILLTWKVCVCKALFLCAIELHHWKDNSEPNCCTGWHVPSSPRTRTAVHHTH